MKNLNYNKQMKDVWKWSLKKIEKKYGRHPTQKSLGLMNKIILSTTETSGLILDPFNSRDETGVVSIINNRNILV